MAASVAPDDMPHQHSFLASGAAGHVLGFFRTYRNSAIDCGLCGGCRGIKPAPMPWIGCGPG